MATDGDKPNNEITPFLKSKGYDEKVIQELFNKCKALHHADSKNAAANWDYLTTIGIQERKLPHVISKCPKILTLDHEERLVPTVQCLLTLGSKPGDVGAAVVKFPNILCHSVDEKLCPLLAFFQSLGVSDKQIGKLLLFNPRLVSYSIETKFSKVVEFLASLGFDKGEHIGIFLKSFQV